MGADDGHADQQRANDSRNGLQEERNQVRRWESVCIGVLCQRPLHSVRLELLRERIDLGEPLAEIGAEAQLLHDLLSHEVGGHHVRHHVVQTCYGKQDHVAHVFVVREAEAHAVGDAGANLVHDLIADNHHHGKRDAVCRAGLLTIVIVEVEHGICVGRVENNCPEYQREEDEEETFAEPEYLFARRRMAEVMPLHGVRFAQLLLHRQCAAFECQPPGRMYFFDGLVPSTLRLENDERAWAGLDAFKE
mmetsp:Transcript_3575/g.10753  ORF Transcript_3575/g.10753 Transcript_3575/m.10753 type:complete len:248 (+) Transcript_3575:842-1585(+)